MMELVETSLEGARSSAASAVEAVELLLGSSDVEAKATETALREIEGGVRKIVTLAEEALADSEVVTSG